MKIKDGYIGTAKIIGDTSVRLANVEHTPRVRVAAKEKNTRFDSQVRITVTSYRRRLADADGTSAKAAIDGLVHCGILQDDSPKWVSEVAYRQVKVGSIDQEKTEILIEELE